METDASVMNRFLVEVFNEILKTEERSLTGDYPDLSIREIHLIEEVCAAAGGKRDNRSTAIAAAQRVTAGTLTTAAGALERKGYLERRRDEKDRRAVRILPTAAARAANALHARFHREMVDGLLAVLTEEETGVLVRALGHLAGFFQEKDRQNRPIRG